MTAGLGIKAGLLLLAETVTSCPVVADAGSDAAETDDLRRVGVLEDRAGLPIGLSVGGWLTPPTVTTNDTVVMFWPPLAVPPSLVTVTRISAVPTWLVFGVKVSVPVVLGLV